METIRFTTAGAPAPGIQQHVVHPFDSFLDAAPEEVEKLIRGAQPKHCYPDAAPTWLVKQCSEILAPVIRIVANSTMQDGVSPDCLKIAVVKP
jgi:hypothetical protein